MSPRYLLDTNALSEPLKPQPNPLFLRKLRTNRGRLAIASITWHEALFGLFRMPQGKRRQSVEEYLFEVVSPSIPILPYDSSAAEWHARERARLDARGQKPPFADGQIAAIAKVHDLVVVTANLSDFERFEEIVVESWWDKKST